MKSQKVRKSHRKKTLKKNTYVSKISIEVDFSKKDGGYEDLRNPRLMSFLMRNMKKGKNLIQTQPGKPFHCHGKTTLHLQAISVNSWPLKPTWKGVKCHKVNDFLKSSPCKLGSKDKVFVKLESNPHIGGMATYLLSINLGLVDIKKHLKFAKTLKKTFGKKPIQVHNEDVNWFHLKESK